MNNDPLLTKIMTILEDIQAIDIKVLDVHELTTITDTMIVCSGNSSRHASSIANRILDGLRDIKSEILGVEGLQEGEWVLIDLGRIVVHIMLPRTRDFYQLEKLWERTQESRKS
jgi:ribosome-associated protein